MTGVKWGESFLKSGLPLEHLAGVTLRALDWQVEPNIEYSRPNREGQEAWFEVDMFATRSFDHPDGTELALFAECKYHDASRFWMFLPYEQGRWVFDDRVFNVGPLQTLSKPRENVALGLAPLSTWGVVVSQDGTKQDNAIYTAVQQLTNAFAPYLVDRLLGYNFDVEDPKSKPWYTATVPAIITNASLYRLKPDVRDLETIRQAASPAAVADELPWTWCYNDIPLNLLDSNLDTVGKALEKWQSMVSHYPFVEPIIRDFADRPNWIAVINVSFLERFATRLVEQFEATQFQAVSAVIRRERQRRKRRR